jgi:hypothetical protein
MGFLKAPTDGWVVYRTRPGEPIEMIGLYKSPEDAQSDCDFMNKGSPLYQFCVERVSFVGWGDDTPNLLSRTRLKVIK